MKRKRTTAFQYSVVWCKLVVILTLTINPNYVGSQDIGSRLQQLQRVWSRVIGDVLGFGGVVLRNINPPTTEDLIRRHGYPCETHYVRTDDDVVLELFRIPRGPTLEFFRFRPREPVILMHGMGQSSSDWFLNTPISDSLGFLLSDSGYDVWIGNHRGNLNKNSRLGVVSWNYSFHEMGTQDTPAIIRYVTRHTRINRVYYIGFSMGTSALMVALSKFPHLNNNIKLGVLMGPSVVHDNWYNGWFKLIAPFAPAADALQNQFGAIPLIHPLVANLLHRILPILCHPRIDLMGICLAVNNIMFGYDKGQITKEKIAQVVQVSPTPISSKLIIHYVQELGSGRFCEYDYGKQKNLQVYGTERPPDYNLTNIISPIAMFIGREDLLAHRRDALTLSKTLRNVADTYFVPYQHFQHLDFLYARDVSSLVYDHLLDVMKRY